MKKLRDIEELNKRAASLDNDYDDKDGIMDPHFVPTTLIQHVERAKSHRRYGGEKVQIRLGLQHKETREERVLMNHQKNQQMWDNHEKQV